MIKILALGDFHGKFPVKLRKEINKADLVLCTGDFGGIKEWYRYLMYLFKEFDKGVPRDSMKSGKEFFGKEKYKELIKKDEKVTKEVLRVLNNLNKKIIFIFGNTDDFFYKYLFDKWEVKKSNLNFIKKLKNLKDITYSKIKYKDINLIGFGGYMDIDEYLKERIKTRKERERRKKVKKRRDKTKKKLFEIIKKTKGKRIFIFHYPPKGFFDVIKDKKNPHNGKSAGISFFLQAIKRYKPSLVLCGHMHEYQGKKKLGDTLIVSTGSANEGKAAIIDFDEEKGKVGGVRFIK